MEIGELTIINQDLMLFLILRVQHPDVIKEYFASLKHGVEFSVATNISLLVFLFVKFLQKPGHKPQSTSWNGRLQRRINTERENEDQRLRFLSSLKSKRHSRFLYLMKNSNLNPRLSSVAQRRPKIFSSLHTEMFHICPNLQFKSLYILIFCFF